MKPKEVIIRSFKLYPTTDQAARYACAGIVNQIIQMHFLDIILVRYQILAALYHARSNFSLTIFFITLQPYWKILILRKLIELSVNLQLQLLLSKMDLRFEHYLIQISCEGTWTHMNFGKENLTDWDNICKN